MRLSPFSPFQTPTLFTKLPAKINTFGKGDKGGYNVEGMGISCREEGEGEEKKG